MDEFRGARFAKLLIDGFGVMVDDAVAELARRGHPGVTATHEFALHAINAGAQNATVLGRDLGVSKQAAAKTITALEDLGYLNRESDESDARRKTLVVTPRGHEMIAIGAASFDKFRSRLAVEVGEDALKSAEAVLEKLARIGLTHQASDAQTG
jgi:DNA-binding MarR family transcriptional regulator